MKQTLHAFLALFVFSLFVGCETVPVKTRTYQTLGTIQAAVNPAMDVYANLVVAERVTPEQQAKVRDLYSKYDAAFRAALDALDNDYTAEAPQIVAEVSADLLTLVEALSNDGS